jgi:hypothetical protein
MSRNRGAEFGKSNTAAATDVNACFTPTSKSAYPNPPMSSDAITDANIILSDLIGPGISVA